ncbi:hypothetical protein AMECASPLE_018514 [Ameca splendens]|uniref:Syndecan n=1 Tax=Ameca splendens TaxID=208324 RepID=A0ABV0XFT1_9TELE
MKNLWLFFLVGVATGFISEKLTVVSQLTTSLVDDLYIEEPGSGDLPVDDEDGRDDESGSGSGSGDYGFSISSNEEEGSRFLNLSNTILYKKELPLPARPTADSAPNLSTTAADRQDPAPTAENTGKSFPDDGNRSDQIPDSTSNCINESPSSSFTPVSYTDFSLPVNEDVKEERRVLIEVVNSDAIPNNGKDSQRHGLNSPEEVTSENLWQRTEVLATVISCGVVGFLCALSLLLLLAYRMKKKDEGSYDLGDTKMSATAYHKAPTKEFYA